VEGRYRVPDHIVEHLRWLARWLAQLRRPDAEILSVAVEHWPRIGSLPQVIVSWRDR
jgi:hypothetical protein